MSQPEQQKHPVPVERRAETRAENDPCEAEPGTWEQTQEEASRQHAEAALRAAEAQLRLITDAVPLLISYVDTGQRFRFNNQTYARWFTRPLEEITGKHVRDVLGEAAYQGVQEYIEAALAGQTVTFERQMDYQAAPPRYAQITFVPDKNENGEVKGFVAVVNDLTERKQAEQERALVLSGARCLLWYADVYETYYPLYLRWEMHIPDLEAAQRFLPLELHPGQIYSDAWYRSRPQEDLDRCNPAATEAIRAGRSYQQEFRCRAKDGTLRWFHEDIHVETIEAGARWRAVGVCMDITARKKAEAEQRFLQEATDLLAASLDYQTTLQSVAQAVVPQLADWCVIHLVNEAGALDLVTVAHADPARVEFAREATRRYPPRPDAPAGPAAVVRTGKSEWIEDIPEAMIRAVARDDEHYRILSAAGMKSSLCAPLIARGKTLGAITFIGAESGHRYSPESLALVEELARRAAIAVDNARLYQAAQREIAERLRAEQALQESRDYYRTLTEAVPQLVWTTRPDGVPDYFNQNWLDYTGQTRDNNRAWWKGSIHPEDRARTMERWQAAVQTGEPYEVEYRLKGASGEYRWFLARGLPLKNAQGEILKWFGTCTLIEDQKRAEQTQRFLAELSERIRPLSDPGEILWMVVNAIGQHLQVTHCTYADIDTAKNQFTSYRDYHWKGETHAGTSSLDIFGTEIVTAMQGGQTFVIQDTRTDARIRHHYETLYAPANIQAFISVPLIKEGRWIAALSVTMHGAPRVWTPEEVGLLEKVMEQTWLAVENVRLLQAERERSEQLAFAISEVHHRVKNSLQAVGALLEIQIPDEGNVMPVEAVKDSLSQIKTIALVHDLLSKDSPIGLVDAAQVLTNLAKLLAHGMKIGDRPLPIRVKAEPIQLPTKAATSLALVVNELLTNAAKHNTRLSDTNSARPGAIEVTLSQKGKEAVVVVRDDGPGFPSDFDPDRDAHIGLQVVQTLVAFDLQGQVTFGNAISEQGGQIEGAKIEIVFPLAALIE